MKIEQKEETRKIFEGSAQKMRPKISPSPPWPPYILKKGIVGEGEQGFLFLELIRVLYNLSNDLAKKKNFNRPNPARIAAKRFSDPGAHKTQIIIMTKKNQKKTKKI